MAFNINLFQGAMRLGGARPSLFQVNITNPANGATKFKNCTDTGFYYN